MKRLLTSIACLLSLLVAAGCRGPGAHTPKATVGVVQPVPGWADQICQSSDGDIPTLPVVDDALMCSGKESTPHPGLYMQRLPPDVPVEDYALVHQLCQKLNPLANTIDHTDHEVARSIDQLFVKLLERPALQKAMHGVPPAKRLRALKDAWLAGNAFEHVLCGEQNPDGKTVGGFHLWSEYQYEQLAGRVRYHCTAAGKDDAHVATFRFDWQPQGMTTRILKPTGGFALGQSPACLLALGYAAHKNAAVSKGIQPAFYTTMYGQRIGWVYWRHDDGTMLTIFPLAR